MGFGVMGRRGVRPGDLIAPAKRAKGWVMRQIEAELKFQELEVGHDLRNVGVSGTPHGEESDEAANDDACGKDDSRGLKGVPFDSMAGVVDYVLGSIAALFQGADRGLNAIVYSIGDDGLDAVDFAVDVVDGWLILEYRVCHELCPFNPGRFQS